MFNIKNKNLNTSNYTEIPSDRLLNNRSLLTTINQRNNHRTGLSSSFTHSSNLNDGTRNNDNRRIAGFVRFVNKTLPRSNCSLRSRNTRASTTCPGEQSSSSIELHHEQVNDGASRRPPASSAPPPEPIRPTPPSPTLNLTVEDDDNSDEDGYTDVGDSSSSSSEDDDDAPFESMYNRRIPIPSTLFANNSRRVVSSRPGVRHNTRRYSLRRQSRYITPDQFNWESHSVPRRNQPSSIYSSAYANLLPSNLSHSRSLSLPSNSDVTNDSPSAYICKNSHSESRQTPNPEKISTRSDADGPTDDDQTEECFICIEPLELRGGRMILNPGCGHLMHMKCYMEYINKCTDSCAICSKKFPSWDH
ncbi:6513_t:CDS:1 [Acaulospora colombiana]|uniref:6513_t:CDS:1 n=1 Tax=Acaulospora colombiana TaxID=27376 RepID=A0ACA9KIT8_9GLOM|nr:6513_t:CDS:1 [Acaulospora colombiana]